jgi:predicted MFS family arabinose efflux permease
VLLMFFLITSQEASAGLWAFTFLTGARGLGTAVAGVAVGAFFGVQTLTRIVLAAVGHRVAAATVLRICVAMTLAGMALTLLPHALSIVGLLVAGLGMGGVYPALMVSSGAQLAEGEAQAAVGYQVAVANAGYAAGSALTGVVLAHLGVGTFPAVELLLVAGAAALLLARSTRRARDTR